MSDAAAPVAAPAAPIVGVVGCGVTGSRVVALLAAAGMRVVAHDVLRGNAVACTRPRGGVVVERVIDLVPCDVVVLCVPAPHTEMASMFLREGTPVVSIGDDLADLRGLLGLADLARRNDTALVVGAGMAPGLSGLLARYLADQLAVLDELHVAIHGTAGPACARQHHEALGDTALGWHDGEWIDPPGGSGRDLVWFPEPVEAHDCYRAALGDPLLLRAVFPTAVRISARVSATRRDRMTSRLPMLSPPHAAGDIGAVRVEARGADADGGRATVIAGASGPTAHLAAAVAAAAASGLVMAGSGRDVDAGVHVLGGESSVALDLLHHATTMGVQVQEFTGVARATGW